MTGRRKAIWHAAQESGWHRLHRSTRYEALKSRTRQEQTTMLNSFRGQRPDLTPAQVAAVLVAGVPAIATLLSAFGIADLSREQQDALGQVLTWSAVLAGLLIGGDATLRTARNVVDGKRDAAAMLAGTAGAAVRAALTRRCARSG
jgi:hypothetical protein